MAKDEQIGRILAGRYRLRHALGRGAHGVVYCAEDLGRSGRHVAFKLTEGMLGGARTDDAERILRHLQHPNWAEVLDSGTLDDSSSFQTTRLIPGRSLDHLEGPQPIAWVWKLLEDGARVLGALHRHGLIHYDVTPGNLILSEEGSGATFVLTDGGLAHVGPVQGIARGTPMYMAPEVTQNKGHDHRADLYSLALVAYRLATGRDPIEGGAGEILGRRRREDAPRASTYRDDLPPALDALLAELLDRNPRQRPRDAAELLARLDAALEYDVPPLRKDEALATAEGGPLVGRDAELARFEESLEALRERKTAGSKRYAQTRASAARDAVLLVHGEPGCGATRLTEEFLDRARSADVPCLLVAGRDQTGDRRGPLRHLLDGLVTLGLKQGEASSTLRLDLGSEHAAGREERTHASTRAVEQFLRGVEQAAKRTPFVLVVQDFAVLPENAKEALRVLSRHLLARREGGGRPAKMTVLLVIDLGAEEPEPLLLPDARLPREPLIELAKESRETLGRICSDRFPGFTASESDHELIHAAAEGMPGTLVSLLVEAGVRGDLVQESGRWQWDVSGLDEYQIQRGLSPAQAEVLRQLDADQSRLLAQVSMLEAPVPNSLLETLWGSRANDALPTTSLVQTSSREGQVFYSPANLAVREAVRKQRGEEESQQICADLLEALRKTPPGDLALDHARMALRLGAHAEALEALATSWSVLATDARAFAQGLILDVIEAAPELLQTSDMRARCAGMLEHGQAAGKIAERLSALLSGPGELVAAEIVAATLRSERLYDAALHTLNAAHPESVADPEVDARLWTAKAMLLFDMHQVDSAKAAIASARKALRGLSERRTRHPRLLAEFLMVDAQARFLDEETARSIRALRAAQIAAKRTRSPALRARLINNMGIVQSQAGHLRDATRSLERALRLKTVLGDVHGAIRTQLNLGRIRQSTGALVKSASMLQAAAGSARRHAQPMAMTRALLLLAQVYDQQLNTRLAASTLSRAARAAEVSNLRLELARASWELAPMAASTDGARAATPALIQSALAARQRVAPYARAAHHVTAALTALHLGLYRRAGLCLRRALRHRDAAYEELHLLRRYATSVLAAAGEGSAELDERSARPKPGAHARFLWRALVWQSRGLRDATLPTSRLAAAQSRRRASLPPLGSHRRLLAESALLVARTIAGDPQKSLLSEMEQRLAHTGERQLRCRVLAVRSIASLPTDRAGAAQNYSRSLDSRREDGASPARAVVAASREHDLAFQIHQVDLMGSSTGRAPNRQEEDALAHQLLVRMGCTAAPDHRVASALRRVLEATGRMNAGAGLDELLEGMTNDTLEITGAERTCVVLVDTSADVKVRVATSASSQEEVVSVEDLSQTVIQRVIEAQTPLLLHDVFDDEELMGRPSITDLSLRSILCVPMLRSDTLYGVMYADSSSAAGSFDQVDLEVLSLFAEQAAAALETHRLVADVQNSMDELKAMQERLVKGERLRTMGELSSGVAHEFNNLLTSILARVQLINLTPVGQELKRDLDLIEKACLDAAEVVRRLQNFTRQQRQGHFVRLDLAEMCRDAVEFLRPLWSTRRRHGRPPVHVQLHVEENLMVNGDPTELREVVTNLLKNALDALADGGEISIAAQALDGVVHLRVMDDGPGMEPEIQARIFDPFYTTKGERGTGLGLCLSQQIVERHGGEMTVESAPGEGAAFLVELPSANAVVQLKPTLRREPRPKTHVLVVDDDANVREPLCRYLEGAGFEVNSAENGLRALDAVAERVPDIVITDVMMPEMDGLELCKELRDRHHDLPIVIMSGWSAGVNPNRAKRAGATAILGKPFALRQVAELLESVRVPGPEPEQRARLLD